MRKSNQAIRAVAERAIYPAAHSAPKCDHADIFTVPDSERCYSGSVVGRYSEHDENRAAHGCIVYTEECRRCGSQRAVNQNGSHFEIGDWGLTAAERKARDEAERQAKIQKQEAAEDALVAARKVEVLQVDEDDTLLLVNGDRKRVALSQIDAATQQEDTGDGLVPFYRGLRRAVETRRQYQESIRVRW